MSLLVSLSSFNNGEIKNFLERFYQKDIIMDDDVAQWAYTFRKPLDAIDLICAIIDNDHQFNISVDIQMDNGNVHNVTSLNCNDIIKGLLYLFSEECPYQNPNS